MRVEAGWDRTAPTAAILNRLSRARDVVLDGHGADRSAQLREQAGVSAVDATVGQAAGAAHAPVAILTSDASDMRRVAALVLTDVRVVRL